MVLSLTPLRIPTSTSVQGLPPNSFIKDVTKYPSLNDLILVSELLISDYSSIFFDYAITGKPMLCYTYDYNRYEAVRGMYFDIREALDMKGCSDSEEQIIQWKRRCCYG